MTDHEHELTLYYDHEQNDVLAVCEVENCGWVYEQKEAEAMLNEHGKLKRVRDAARHVASIITTIRQVMVKDHTHKEVFGGMVYLVDHSQMWVLVRNAEDLIDTLADTEKE